MKPTVPRSKPISVESICGKSVQNKPVKKGDDNEFGYSLHDLVNTFSDLNLGCKYEQSNINIRETQYGSDLPRYRMSYLKFGSKQVAIDIRRTQHNIHSPDLKYVVNDIEPGLSKQSNINIREARSDIELY